MRFSWSCHMSGLGLAARVATRLCCATVALVVHAACVRIETGAPASNGDRLIVGTIREPTTLNPLLLEGFVAGYLDALVFSNLTAYDAAGNIAPMVARDVPTKANGGISADGRRVTYHLRGDVRWQDGKPLTARDVVFTYHAIMDLSNKVPIRYGYDRVASVVAPDPYTVVLHLRRPFAAIIPYFFGGDSNVAILPEHVLARYRDLNKADFNHAPIGSGPFKIERWKRGDLLVFTANDGYFLGRPALRTIVLKFVPDSGTLLNQLSTGEIDATLLIDDAARLGQFRRVLRHRVFVTPDASFGALVFNTKDPLLSDPVLRRAVATAVDRATNAAKIGHGAYDSNAGMRGLFTWAFDPSADNSPFDPRAASGLLERAGWRRGLNGVRRKDGRALELQIAFYSGAETPPRFVTAIADQLSAVGIAASVKRYAMSPAEQAFSAGRFQIAFFIFGAAGDPDPSWLVACDQRAPGGFNWARYCSRAVDAALSEGARSFDRGARRAAYARVQRRLLLDLPLAFLFQGCEIDVIPNGLSGFVPSLYFSPFATARRWRWTEALRS
jgi:peptide/nickel transport system substrate-binding protein